VFEQVGHSVVRNPLLQAFWVALGVLDIVVRVKFRVSTFVCFEVFVVLQHFLHEAIFCPRYKAAFVLESWISKSLDREPLLVILNNLIRIPLPVHIVVLEPDCEVQVPKEMGEGEHKEFVAKEHSDPPDLVGSIEVFSVPFVEVLIAVIDQLDFLKREVVLIFRLWRVEHVPKSDKSDIQVVVDEKSEARHT